MSFAKVTIEAETGITLVQAVDRQRGRSSNSPALMPLTNESHVVAV
jgi:hypothetical protein